METTITISKDVYKKLVEMAIKRYRHARAISKVIENLVRVEERKRNVKKIIKKVKELRKRGCY